MELSAAIPFDLIVLSLSLAGDDPLDLALRLRAAQVTREIPLLLVAEPEQHDQVLRGFDLGADDWLVLPLDENELRARARNQIRRKLYQDRLRQEQATACALELIDPLTGLYNQRYLVRHLRGLLESSPNRELAALMVDIDRLSAVNEEFGHASGDAVLRAIAGVLRENTRVFDSLARYAGGEFVVVMPGAGPGEAAQLAERLRSAIEAAPLIHKCPITVSIGVACRQAPDTPEALLHAADLAVGTARQAGGNRVEIAGGAT
jgi:two-component system cell cycle response regulator